MSTVFVVIFLAVLATLFGVVLLRILSGQINTRGLMGSSASAPIEPERLQALIVAIGIPVIYAAEVISAFRADPTLAALPDAPEWMLVGAAGSQVLYMAGKISRTVTRPTL